MTVILGYFDTGIPILFGDLLLSGNEVKGKDIHIPGIGRASDVFPAGDGAWTVTGLTQKVCILNDNLAIAWSGTAIAASSFINEILESVERVTFSSIKECFDKLSTCKLEDELSIIALIIDEDTHLTSFHTKNTASYNSKIHGMVIGAGTGQEAVKEVLDARGNQNIEYDSQENSLFNYFINLSWFSSNLTAVEISSHRTLLHYFGGGYEAVTNVDGKLCKLDNYAIVYWEVEKLSNGDLKVKAGFKLFYYTYIKSNLFIRSMYLLLVDISSQKFELLENKLFIIPPVHGSCTGGEMINTSGESFKFNYICHYISKYTEETGEFLGVKYLFESKKDSSIKITINESNKYVIEIKKSLLDDIEGK